MKHKALYIAKFFIVRGVSPLKLQKLLYYTQLWYYKKHQKKLFNDDIQAWIFGPVIYDVWSKFRFMKRTVIIPKSRATDLDLCDHVKNHLHDIWSSYEHLSDVQLVDLTHS